MNLKFIGLICVAVFCLVATVSAGKGKGGRKNMTCKGEPLKLDLWKGKKECAKKVIPASAATTEVPAGDDAAGESSDGGKKKGRGQWKAYQLCIAVCKWKKDGILNSDGTYNSTGTETYMQNFPESVRTQLKTEFDTCSSSFGGEFSMENKCAGYQKFKKCSMDKFMEVCEIKRGKGGKGKGGDSDSASDADS